MEHEQTLFPMAVNQRLSTYVLSIDCNETDPALPVLYINTIFFCKLYGTFLMPSAKRVIAEGVEHDHQLDSLRAFHCDLVQGYLISKPLNEDDVLEFLEKIISCIHLVRRDNKETAGYPDGLQLDRQYEITACREKDRLFICDCIHSFWMLLEYPLQRRQVSRLIYRQTPAGLARG